MKKLILLAAMLATVLTGAVPALAQDVAAGQYVSGDGSNAPPDVFDGVVLGTVTSISGSVVFVEEDPSSDSGSKGYFTVTDETEITTQEDGESVPATFEDLEVGQPVEAAYDGEYATSDPPQGNARSITILWEDGRAEEVAATGVIEPLADNPDARHGMTDEATDQFYALRSDTVDLDAYADSGQRVTVYGTVLQTLIATEYPVLDVSRVEPADGPGEAVAVTFELAIEGVPPADATFFGSLGHEPAYFPLADLDGDDLYTATTPTGLVSAGDVQPARIFQGTGTRESRVVGLVPGEPVSTIKDFGEVRFDEDTTLAASVSFAGDKNDDKGGIPGGSVVRGIKTLPATGGILSIAGLAGLVIVAGDLVARRIAR